MRSYLTFSVIVLSACTHGTYTNPSNTTRSVSAPYVATDSNSLDGSRGPVEALHAALGQMIANGTQIDFKSRYALMQRILEQTVEFEAVSIIALGEKWKGLSAQEQTTFISTLKNLSAATYSSAFKPEPNDKFIFVSSKPLNSGNYVITYNLSSPREAPVKFEYLVRNIQGRFKIINIVVDGISDLAIKKAQYICSLPLT